MRRILITGGTGQVGTELLRCPWPDDIHLVAPTRRELDLGDCENIVNYIAQGDFRGVINCGAYTAVDRAENDILAAWRINALAPAAIAAATGKLDIPVVHLSTDYVFDGRKSEPYSEDDAVAPIGVYGASKEAGEQAIRTGNPHHVIVRTAWIFSAHGANFVKTILRLAEERAPVKVVNDQRGCPTAASDVASAVTLIILRLIEDGHAPVGTYNFVNDGSATWYDFASEIFKRRRGAGHEVPALEAIGTDRYPTPARRPTNSRLATEKFRRDFGIDPRDWLSALQPVLDALSK